MHNPTEFDQIDIQDASHRAVWNATNDITERDKINEKYAKLWMNKVKDSQEPDIFPYVQVAAYLLTAMFLFTLGKIWGLW